jgi:hypothetical protein
MRIMKFYFFILFFILLQSKSFSSTITYEEILNNPTDLELNLNYAKQQEIGGNIKSTIATLERLSKLYPKNSDIKIYLLSILLRMDSKIKVDFMVKTMLEDPNTGEKTKRLIATLLSDNQLQKTKQNKWIAYLDINYSQTEEDNISGRTKSGKLLKSNGTTDSELPFPVNDSRLTLEYDKTYVRGTSLTLGRIIDKQSSIYMNFGSNLNTNNKKLKGESDIHSFSLSYLKIHKNHYFTPYLFFNNLNYRMQEDYQRKGVGINNTYLFNDKLNLNYSLSYTDNRYHSEPLPVDSFGTQLFVDAGDLNNSEVYNSYIKLNYNLSDKARFSSKLIYSETDHSKNFDSHDSLGANISFSKIFPLGTATISATHLTNEYKERKTTISSLKDREDTSLVTNLSFRGDINKILPFLSKINKDNTIFYTLSFRESNVNSSILSYERKRSFKTIGISKRINFNG